MRWPLTLCSVLAGAWLAAMAPAPHRIDVVVMDRHGQPATDLAIGDFELRVDGVTRPILTASRRDAPRFTTEPLTAVVTDTDARRVAQQPGTRVFAFYLDEDGVRRGPSAGRVRDAAADFIEQKVHDRDLTLVVRPRDDAASLPFSRDRAWAQGAIEAFAGRQGEKPVADRHTLQTLARRLARFDADRAVLVIATASLDAELEDVARAAAAGHVAIYSFDPTPSRSPGRASQLAIDSGGLAIGTDTRSPASRGSRTTPKRGGR